MKDVDICTNIIESNGSKEMKYYITHGKRKITAMRRSAKTPEEAVVCYRKMKSFKKFLLEAIKGCGKMNEGFPKAGLGVSFFLLAILGAIIHTMFDYGIGVISIIFALLTFTALFQVLIVTKRAFETMRFIELREPQQDLEDFMKAQEELLLAKFKNTRINPYSGELEVINNKSTSN